MSPLLAKLANKKAIISLLVGLILMISFITFFFTELLVNDDSEKQHVSFFNVYFNDYVNGTIYIDGEIFIDLNNSPIEQIVGPGMIRKNVSLTKGDHIITVNITNLNLTESYVLKAKNLRILDIRIYEDHIAFTQRVPQGE